MTVLTDLKYPSQINHRPSQDAIIYQVWGQGPSERYDALAQQFRPIFEKIKRSTNQREKHHILPFEQLQWLKDSGFTRLRLPQSHHGFDATIPELFALLIELAQADANLPQILRVHFGFTEDILLSQHTEFKELWLKRIGRGETVGSAWSEGGKESIDQFSTHLSKTAEGKVLLNGTKYYTTGSLYAEWIDVGISDLEGNSASILIPRHATGVEVIDDWNGFGQVLTASGTAIFKDVEVNPADVLADDDRFKYSAGFYQLIQLAIITGLTRAASYDLSHLVETRTRNYTHANTQHVRHDPQILQVVGKIRGAAYSATAIIEKNAQALQRTYHAALQQNELIEADQNAIAELEIAQSQTIITDLALNASSIIFDALGASATDKNLALDRYWRNIRTLASHNPRIYKDRIVGDFSVNGHLPPYQWRIGQA
ncbi:MULTISPECIES: acyl-CoA dehydrogenase family protein [unclassified Acinetobacter]|uniref:acyl-CoA dehydrogenase family protein n=1 Tax=unclassified Acinetobacter TaxID=196816 RepID=UPI00293461BB|nr:MULTISPECIES: acyl-CoA dehydrogenase family protein [unclassified Acinetobacter]WOE32473.1 monooxygenase [Acinetobacter sp. SAAs470]WOE37949.1 monooxygenase [Acinetobacter sp. SAAs474]